MAISKKMQDAINDQINKEFYSAYLYLAMSAEFAARNLGGFAHWLHIQFTEEQEHALKFYEHLLERGGSVALKPIAQPAFTYTTNLAAFEQVAEHEAAVTASIYNLYETALSEKDYPAQVLLQWYINEQVEEEKNAAEIVESLKRIDAHDTAVLMLDHQLGKRGGD